MPTDFVLIQVLDEDLHTFDPHFTDMEGNVWVLVLFSNINPAREDYLYEITKELDSFSLHELFYVTHRYSSSVEMWDTIKVPYVVCEYIDNIGMDELLSGDNAVFLDELLLEIELKKIQRLSAIGEAYYTEAQTTLFDLEFICDIDGYTAYANRRRIELTDGVRFYFPYIGTDVIMWVWERLYHSDDNPW